MKINLKKIKYEFFDNVLDKTVDESIANGRIIIDTSLIENNSEPVLINGKEIVCEIDVKKYEAISSSEIPNYMKEAKIAILLHNDLIDLNGNTIPKKILYEKEVWAYLSLMTFKNVVCDLKITNINKINYDVISRVFFSVGSDSKIDRTCLMFYWIFVDTIGSCDDLNIIETAFEFIDPVKAIFERTMSKNGNLLKAYIEAIIKIGKPKLIKSQKYRSFIPSNLSCFYAVNTYDASDYNEIVESIAEQINQLIE